MNPDGAGLRCYVCQGRILAVRDSRRSRNAVRRRRQCLNCRAKFTTFEILSPTQEDTYRLFAALDFYEQMSALSEAHRNAILAMVKALPRRADAQPLQIGHEAGRLSLDAALAPPEPEDAPFP
jgi:hypothetical protein